MARILSTIAIILSAAAYSICQSSNPAPVAFTHDVAPILQKHCQTCHRPGEAAPFPMLTYEQTRPWAAAMKIAVAEKRMPPWFAEPKYGHFANERSLAAEEIRTLVSWVNAGAPKGTAEDMPPPVKSFVEGWGIATPDI